MMWLPKDERRLLAGYYSLIGDVGTEKVYRLGDLARLLRFRGHKAAIPEYGVAVASAYESGDLDAVKREVVEYIQASKRIQKANNLLAKRDLIHVTPHQHEPDVVAIALSVDGYDLGRRYSNVLESSGLCFQEYRNHWMWLIVASLGGGFVVKLIEWIGTLVK